MILLSGVYGHVCYPVPNLSENLSTMNKRIDILLCVGSQMSQHKTPQIETSPSPQWYNSTHGVGFQKKEYNWKQ